MKYSFSILLAFCFVTVLAFGQKVEPKYTFNVELTLPGAVVNEPFSDIMQGLACGAVYGQYSFPFHLNIGAGIKYSLFTINEFHVPSPVYGNMQSGTGFMKIGWDKFHNDRFATDVGLKVGYTENFFATDVNKQNEVNPWRVNSTNVEGTLGLILTADEKTSYRLVLGYGAYGFGFKPEMIGLASNEGYDSASFNKVTQYFIVGFGYTYYFGQKSASD